MTEDLTRRRLFGLASASAAGAAGLSLSGCSTGIGADPTLATQAADASAGFVSRPDLTPPRITIRRSGLGADSQYIFLNAPFSGPGHGGTIILNPHGDLVWFGPNTSARRHMNFAVQTYNSQPVLTWWQGQIVAGFGEGELVIADSSYKILHTIRAVGGQTADFHEFYITPQNTALITIYRRHSGVDLRAVGGPASGYLVSGVAQEIDITTGKLLWQWDSWDHAHPQVALTETYQQFGVGDGGNGTHATPFNYFHINSLAIDQDGDLLISARNTCAIYKVSRQTSKIVWRLNGKKSDFTMGPRSKFWWQHHVRPHGNGRLTVFDNAANGPTVNEKQSRALILSVDTTAMHASLKKAYIHPGQQLVAGAMGSAQLLGDGRMFVGWGTEPYFSEFSADGRLLMDGIIEKGDASYRAFSQNWSGQPTELPAAAARHRTGGATVYASWNGATEVRSWAVFAGKTRTSLTEVGAARKTGFETAIAVPSKGPYFAVQARDSKGRALSKSATVKIS
ncbi:MAG TPA: arylsulfotransferase family protein [Streptosporangiaceae bacterium]|nr:arylsulfotransferase family protein [Streptosporangiaceae bacterium]